MAGAVTASYRARRAASGREADWRDLRVEPLPHWRACVRTASSQEQANVEVVGNCGTRRLSPGSCSLCRAMMPPTIAAGSGCVVSHVSVDIAGSQAPQLGVQFCAGVAEGL